LAEAPKREGQKRNIWKALFNRKMLICIMLGFTSGLPLYVLIQLVPAWMRSDGVDLGTIGLLSLVLLPYTWKFLWAPFMDRFRLPILGRRRSWALLTQIILLVLIWQLGAYDPSEDLEVVTLLLLAICFVSASQDIVVDAYRRELLNDDELGTGNSFFVNAYRISSLIPGSLALILSDLQPWAVVYAVVAIFMAVGIITMMIVREPSDDTVAPTDLQSAVIKPFQEFFSRSGWRAALAILAFMFLYKLGDNMATALSTPFYLDLGFTRTQIGSIAKVAALWSSIAGSIIAGVVMLKININRALWLFGVVQLTSIFGFAILAKAGANPYWLFVAVSFEYLGVGLGTVALTAFIARETSKRFSATQLALLTSFTALPRALANSTTGFLVEAVGWFNFFLLCAVVAIPGMLLLFWVAPWSAESKSSAE